ncbi:MAG: hypothetical protein F4Z28_14650, partial [Gammaproteobacteria bacterium]|nr:hypothetical protein [Gammaproteobacteria bacterium]
MSMAFPKAAWREPTGHIPCAGALLCVRSRRRNLHGRTVRRTSCRRPLNTPVRALAARLFGDIGAGVLLVEPSEGHPLRHEPPFVDDTPGLDTSVIHAYFNWNKHSARADSPSELAEALGGADVVVTTTVAPTPELADILSSLPPDTVHLSITPHGLEDALTDVPGNNLTMGARVGWASINRFAEEAPLQLPRDSSGVVGGVTGFIAAAAALRRRHAVDSAERVDVSELEAFALT